MPENPITNLNPTILYEDEHILVLNKPSGLPSAPRASAPLPSSQADTNPTAAGFVLSRRPESAQAGGHPLEGGLLHRLDTGTSGLLAFAKTAQEFSRLRELWTGCEVTKTYRAVAAPKATASQAPDEQHDPLSAPLPAQGVLLDDPIAHSAKSSRKMIVVMKTRRTPKSSYRGAPRPALTEIRSILPLKDGRIDIELRIRTGVRHQIRAHLASIGWPILGDSTYGGGLSERLWLHAWRLELPLLAGATLQLEAALPVEWPGAS